MARTVEEIAEELLELIELKSQTSYRKDNKWKHHYENVMQQLEQEIKLYKEIIVENTDNNLTLNKIEAEGYMRGLITMVNRFRDDEKWMEE